MGFKSASDDDPFHRDPPGQQRILCSLSRTKPRDNYHKYREPSVDVSAAWDRPTFPLKLPILSFPVKPVDLSTVSLSHYDQPSLTKPVCSAVTSDLELQSEPTHFLTPPELSVLPVCLCFELQVSHTFTDYGPGLSYISFEHGGQDTKFWDGWFGVRVTGSSVTVEVWM